MCIKIACVIIKFEDFDSDTILLDEKSYEIFWFKIWLEQNLCVLGSIK